MAKFWSEEEIYLVAERGHRLLEQGQYEEASIVFDGLLAVAPANRYCRIALATAYLALSQPGAALQVVEHSLALFPSDADLHRLRAEAMLILGQTEGARQELEWLSRSVSGPSVTRLVYQLETTRRNLS